MAGWLAMGLSAMGLAGCLWLGEPQLELDEVGVVLPEDWQAPAAAGDGVSARPQGWLERVDSDSMRLLVTEALVSNRDLQATALRLEAETWDTLGTTNRLFPSLGFDAGASRRAGEGRPGTLESSNTFSTSLDLNWEVDVWGKLRRQNRADRSELWASRWDFYGAKLSLAARAGQAWCDVVTAREQLDLARQRLEGDLDDMRSIESAFDLGVDEVQAVDVRLAENQVEAARARVVERQQDLRVARRALEVIMGRYPAAELRVEEGLPPLWDLDAGVPLALLGRRPDVVAARRRSLAQMDRDAAAQLNWLPDFSISAGGGRTSSEVADLFDFPNLTRQIGVNLVQPIFEGGALWAERKAERLRTRALIEDYAQVLLVAMQEVEDALDAEVFLERRLQSELRAAQRADEALELARESYARGVSESSVLFDAQQRVLDARVAVLDLRNLRWQNRLDLVLALGGDV